MSQSDLFARPKANAVRDAAAAPAAPAPVRSPAYWDAYYAAMADMVPPAPRGPNICSVCSAGIGELTPAVPVQTAWMHRDPCWSGWRESRVASAHRRAEQAVAA